MVDWLKSYKPEELFNEDGSLMDDIKAVIPKGDKRMAANPITNAGGNNARILRLNDIRDFAVPEDELKDSSNTKMDTRVLSDYIADIMKENPDNFRMWGPDETKSNRFYSVLDEDKRQFMEDIHEPNDENVAHSGRVFDVQLSEHQAEGMLEGYVLTGQ